MGSPDDANRDPSPSSPDGSAPDPVATWSDGLAHQLRNQQMVLSNSLFSLRAAATGDDTTREACLRLAESGIQRSIEILESFTALAYPAREALTPYLSELLGWWEVLIAPRVKRREAILEVEIPEVTPRVASGPGVWALTALAERLLPHLSTDARVSIFVRTDRAESPEVAVAIADLEPNPLAELAVELASVVPGARLAAGESGPLLLVPVAPEESRGDA